MKLYDINTEGTAHKKLILIMSDDGKPICFIGKERSGQSRYFFNESKEEVARVRRRLRERGGGEISYSGRALQRTVEEGESYIQRGGGKKPVPSKEFESAARGFFEELEEAAGS